MPKPNRKSQSTPPDNEAFIGFSLGGPVCNAVEGGQVVAQEETVGVATTPPESAEHHNASPPREMSPEIRIIGQQFVVAWASAVRPFRKPGADTVRQMPGFCVR